MSSWRLFVSQHLTDIPQLPITLLISAGAVVISRCSNCRQTTMEVKTWAWLLRRVFFFSIKIHLKLDDSIDCAAFSSAFCLFCLETHDSWGVRFLAASHYSVLKNSIHKIFFFKSCAVDEINLPDTGNSSNAYCISCWNEMRVIWIVKMWLEHSGADVDPTFSSVWPFFD